MGHNTRKSMGRVLYFHIDHISLKISRVIGILTRLRHTVPIDVLLLLYNSLVLPHINYSLLVWGHNPFRITKNPKKMSANHNV